MAAGTGGSWGCSSSRAPPTGSWAHAIARSRGTARAKGLVAASVVINLLFLGFFKYFNFFVESAHAIAAVAGPEPDPPAPRRRPPRRHLLLHVPEHQLHRRRLPRRDRAGAGSHRLRALRGLLPPHGGRPDHALERAAAADAATTARCAGGHLLGLQPRDVGPLQEGRHRRQPGRDRRPRSSRPHSAHDRRDHAPRGTGLRLPDLLRLLRLHRHRPRAWPGSWASP